MGLQEVAQIVVPGALALGGSMYGASRAGVNADKAELWPVLGETTTVLARAKVELHHGFLRWTGDVLDTSPEGEEALRVLQATALELAELHGKIVMRTPDRSPIAAHFINAQLALGRATDVLALADRWPVHREDRYDLEVELAKMEEAEETFANEHGEFLQSANEHLSPWKGRRLRVRRRFGRR